ncbi:multicopper oxidase family protein [Jiangella rhizosphaerae]|uniref:Multicopper oxidase family protein n=1 Tax=Jiangella rhizosphaerae TaxID=2293569 RepID=A0A418KVI9_9ACTN|nr:multicopper oxidase family protein [Jiangella rhizosphaerae]RIQ32194.1 multicopper oxidase family protein [Jiangella rhizosphaerae]
MPPGSERRLRRNNRLIVGTLAALAVLVTAGLVWTSSRLPDTYSVMGMGHAEFGGGPADPVHGGHAGHGWDGPPRQLGDRDVTGLTGPRDRPPDVAVELVAARDGDRYTLNGTTPGPELRVRQGDLVEVTLVNESVPDGVTLHWHGVDVPNAEDGVAGVTQDAVATGGSHTYRFVAEDAGTYWYHSHQVSHAQVRGGLFGTLVVTPPAGEAADHDVVAAMHTYGDGPTVNGRDGLRVDAAPGEAVRLRLVNTDNEVKRAWTADAPVRVLAVDGRAVHEPVPVTDAAVTLPAGGRVDLGFTVPAAGTAVRVELGGVAVVTGPAGAPDPPESEPPAETVDLLHYGTPAPLGFDPDDADRTFEYRIGRRFGLVDGRPGMYWTINGGMVPDVPMFVVSDGDVVRMRIENSGADNHPMHLHGHHAVVLSRDGEPATGSPWVVDSLDVGRDETYEIAFVADNPGIWLDHCHDLSHATAGLVAHLVYSGVYTPFRIGGPGANEPE